MSSNFAFGDSVAHLMAKLLQKGIPDAPVVDDDGELVGIFSEVDRIKLVVQTFMLTQVE